MILPQSLRSIGCYTYRDLRERHGFGGSTSVIVSMAVKLSLAAVDESVAMPEDRGLELEVTVVVDESVAMLEDRGLELEVTVVVDVDIVVLEGGELGLAVAGGLLGGFRWVGTLGNVVFWAGHPEGPASRRTGQ